jgi:hypothetical protein
VRRLLAATATAATIAGCGSSPDPGWRETLDCSYTVHKGTRELFAQDLWQCVHEGETYNVYEFANSESRDRWREIGEYFGAKVIDEGDNWLAVTP